MMNLPTLLLAVEHFDPSRAGNVAKFRKPTKSTPYAEPDHGDYILLAGDGGARVVILEAAICDTDLHVYWTFLPAAEDDARKRIGTLVDAYAKPAEAPRLPLGEAPGYADPA